VAYSPEQKASAVDIVRRHGGLKAAALDEVEALLGKRISTSTLHGWLSKSGSDSESKIETPKPKTEIVVSKPERAPTVVVGAPDEDLDPQHLAFIDAYFEENWNGRVAAIRVGYSPASAHVQASRLLKNAKVAAEIRRRLDAAALTREQVLANVSDMANANMADFLTIPGVWPYIDLLKAQERGKLHLIKKYKVQNDGSVVLELWDKRGPNRDMGLHHGLWDKGVEVPLDVDLVVQLVQVLEMAGMNPVQTIERMIEKARRVIQQKAEQNVNERASSRPD
jgi:hypothetical protein